MTTAVHLATTSGTRCGKKPRSVTSNLVDVTCLVCKRIGEREEERARARRDRRMACNQWSRSVGALRTCGAPAAYQTTKGGQRWCAGCLETQRTDALGRIAVAKRDLARLDALQPFEVPEVIAS